MPLLDFKIDKTFQQTHTLSFKIPVGDPKTFHLAEDVTLEFEDEFYYITEIGPDRNGASKIQVVTAVARWYRLGERTHDGQFAMVAERPDHGLKLLLTAAQEQGGFSGDEAWSVGQTTGDETLYSFDMSDATYLAMLYEWARLTGNEISFDTRRRLVHLLPTISGKVPFGFRYERNLEGITQKAIPPEVTRLVASGRNGITIKDLNGGSEVLEDYSFYTNQGISLADAKRKYRKDYKFTDNNAVDAQALLVVAQKELARLSQPQVSYKAKVTDLSTITGFPETRFQPGDFAIVEDRELGIQVTTRVSKSTRYPYEPHRNTIDLTNDPLQLPTGSTTNPSSSLTDDDWELFRHENSYERILNGFSGISQINALNINVPSHAERVVGHTIRGMGVEDGTLRLTFFIDTHDAVLMPPVEISITNGKPFSFSQTFAEDAMPTGKYNLATYAQMVDGLGEAVVAELESQLWALVRGAQLYTPPDPDTQLIFNYQNPPSGGTNPNHTWIVPAGVTMIRVTLQAGTGSCAQFPGPSGPDISAVPEAAGVGGKAVTLKFWVPVTPGETLYLWVPQGHHRMTWATGQYESSYPGGGNGQSPAGGGFEDGGGGGQAVIARSNVLLGITRATLIGCAGGGGGGANVDSSFTMTSFVGGRGGDAGWIGEHGRPGIYKANGILRYDEVMAGSRGTHSEGGQAITIEHDPRITYADPVTNVPSPGAIGSIVSWVTLNASATDADGGFMRGGNGGGGSSAFILGGMAGGGGGWYGGGAGGWSGGSGTGIVRGGAGGGGSSMVGYDVFDLNLELTPDDDEGGDGQIIIEWNAPVI